MSARGRRGFTLIELLVAAAITALIASFVLSTAGNMLESWTRAEGRNAAQVQARLALDQLTVDLQGALYRDDGQGWLAATVLDESGNSGLWQSATRQKPAGEAAGSLRLMTPACGDARFGLAGVWLRFFTTAQGLNDDSSADRLAETASAPVAVSYQVIRRRRDSDPASEACRYLLYRAVVRPARAGVRAGTLEAGCNLDPAGPIGAYTGSDPANDGAEPGDPFSVRHPGSPEGVLAENVVDFGLRLYRRDAAGGMRLIFPAAADDRLHVAMEPPSGPHDAECFPAMAEVMVRVLTEKGARLVAALESGPATPGARPAQYRDDAEWWWGVVEANSEVFTRRIQLPAPAP